MNITGNLNNASMDSYSFEHEHVSGLNDDSGASDKNT